jgi:hypothetical protein
VFSIYYLTTDGEGIKYIGLTKRELSIRLNAHISKAFRRKKLNRAQSWIKSRIKIGKNIQIVKIESDIKTIEEANEREKYWIKHYKNTGNDLLNSTEGGDSIKSYWDGRKQTREHSEKIREALTGRKLSDKHKETMRKNRIEKMVGNKEVLCFNQQGVFYKKFKSCGRAASELKIGRSSVIKCANGNKRSSGGYLFRYMSEFETIPEFIEVPKRNNTQHIERGES